MGSKAAYPTDLITDRSTGENKQMLRSAQHDEWVYSVYPDKFATVVLSADRRIIVSLRARQPTIVTLMRDPPPSSP